MLSLVKQGKRADILQFTLVMLADLLNGLSCKRTLIILDVNGFSNEVLSLDIIDPLLKFLYILSILITSLLQHEDEAVPILSAQVITILIGSSLAVQIPIPALKIYFNWLCTMCKKPHTSIQDLAVQYFAGALRSSRNRLIFWDHELTCSNEVVELLKTKKDLQLQYHTLLVVWLITFEKKIASELNKYLLPLSGADSRKHDIIPILVEISKTAIKEKVNRLVIGIFRV